MDVAEVEQVLIVVLVEIQFHGEGAVFDPFGWEEENDKGGDWVRFDMASLGSRQFHTHQSG
jgi:hypothetical protein